MVNELERRKWVTKTWTTRDGRSQGGCVFDKARLHCLLANVLYTGKVRHKQDIYDSEHETIVDAEVFDRVQRQLRRNGRPGNSGLRSR